MTDELLALSRERSGMVFAPNRRVEAETGIARAHEARGRDGPGRLPRSCVRDDAAALDDLVDELVVGETHFMRDPDQLELIRREVLPALEAPPASRGPPARVWSAGCATGEEAYSLAILLEEEGLDEGAVVLGTDLSAAALAKARAASYSAWSMRGVSGRVPRGLLPPQEGAASSSSASAARCASSASTSSARRTTRRQAPSGWTSSSAGTSSSTSTTRPRDGSRRAYSTASPKAGCCSPRAPTRSSASTRPSRSR